MKRRPVNYNLETSSTQDLKVSEIKPHTETPTLPPRKLESPLSVASLDQLDKVKTRNSLVFGSSERLQTRNTVNYESAERLHRGVSAYDSNERLQARHTVNSRTGRDVNFIQTPKRLFRGESLRYERLTNQK